MENALIKNWYCKMCLYLFSINYYKMENRFPICWHDSLFIGTRSECDRLSCQEGKHSPVFHVYYHKANNEYFYCLNRKQLGQ